MQVNGSTHASTDLRNVSETSSRPVLCRFCPLTRRSLSSTAWKLTILQLPEARFVINPQHDLLIVKNRQKTQIKTTKLQQKRQRVRSKLWIVFIALFLQMDIIKRDRERQREESVVKNSYTSEEEEMQNMTTFNK